MQAVLREPVTCSDGFSYERTAVEGWLKHHNTSFVTGQPLPDLFMVANKALKSRLQELGAVS